MYECCGTCRFHVKEDQDDWWCDNLESDFYADFTDYQNPACTEYEARSPKPLSAILQREIDDRKKRFERNTF